MTHKIRRSGRSCRRSLQRCLLLAVVAVAATIVSAPSAPASSAVTRRRHLVPTLHACNEASAVRAGSRYGPGTDDRASASPVTRLPIERPGNGQALRLG